jgi:hypothetical protein
MLHLLERRLSDHCRITPDGGLSRGQVKVACLLRPCPCTSIKLGVFLDVATSGESSADERSSYARTSS